MAKMYNVFMIDDDPNIVDGVDMCVVFLGSFPTEDAAKTALEKKYPGLLTWEKTEDGDEIVADTITETEFGTSELGFTIKETEIGELLDYCVGSACYSF